jgi:hypothetical protein
MFGIGSYFGLKGEIDIDIVVVGEHRGDQIGRVFHGDDVSAWVAVLFDRWGWHPQRSAAG